MRIPLGFMIGLVVGAVSFVSRGALASPTYPPVVRDTLGMTCTPQCIVCHTTNEGGSNHMNQFGDTMTGAGARAFNEQSVRTALATIASGKVGRMANWKPAGTYDTDGDGVDDISELKGGDLPGTPGANGKGLACSAVEYGCGARVAPKPPQTPASLAALGTVLLFVGSRLRRRRPARR